jgi:hypothetical protein
MPAPHYNQSAIRGCWGAAAKGAAALRPYDPAPFAIRHSRFAVFSIHHSPFAIFHHSLFAIRNSPYFSARRSLLAIFHHSPFAIRYSPYFSVRYSPPLSGGEPVSAGIGRSYWSGGVTSVILLAWFARGDRSSTAVRELAWWPSSSY